MAAEKVRKWIIGVDEAGRGPLAGPVSVGVVAFRRTDRAALGRVFAPIKGKDSKKLTEKEREYWFSKIFQEKERGRLSVAQSGAGEVTIDSKGIVFAIRSAMKRSLRKLHLNPLSCTVLLDGSLKAPSEYVDQQTIVRGDETQLAIRLASIVAKVLRDKKMVSLSRTYPQYSFHIHKGYGTKKHQFEIRKHGLSPVHRRTFCRFL
jgi:ribonuclease HII